MRVLTELGLVHRIKPASIAKAVDDALVLTESGCTDDELAELDADAAAARGVIRGWSSKSRLRMMYRFTTLDWSQMKGVPEMLTLTYPREFPTSGRVVKSHLRAFVEAWFREFGDRIRGVWKLEFQRRGAPHLHLYVGRPYSMSWREFHEWASLTWYRIVGSGDERHLRAGVGVDRQFCSRSKSVKALAWYFAKHNAKHGTKHYQNEVPEGFGEVGRFWGYWGLDVRVTRVDLTTEEFVQFRRLLARLRKSKTGQRRGAPSRLIGLWALSVDGFALAARMGQMDLSPAPSVREWLAARRRSDAVALVPIVV